MEENNRKGPGIFYAVVGVATLVVAIIGATFAYFSATAENTGDPITGQTAELTGEALSVSATQYTFPSATVSNKDLVPAEMAGTDVVAVNKALTANCENNNYTGCHVWDITVTTANDLEAATITLAGSVDAEVATDWKYIVYRNTSNSAATATSIVTSGNFNNASVDLNALDGDADNPKLAKGTYHYYLMVYLANDNANSQNAGDDEDATGTYTGTVTLDAANGGNVVASFVA